MTKEIAKSRDIVNKSKVSKLFTSSLLLLTSYAAFALPHYGDPNQGYDRIPGTRATPHVAWMKPTAGGPIKALFIVPYHLSRSVVEIGQRLDIEPTWIMTAGISVRTQAYREGSIATPIVDREADLVLEKIMRERLLDRSKKYDVLVICKVSWDVFDPAEKAEILRRVREDGTGLVWFGPNRYARKENKMGIGTATRGGELVSPDADYDALVGAYDPSVAETILKGVPVDALPVAPDADHAKVVADVAFTWPNTRPEMMLWVGTAKLGKGRTVAIDYQENETKVPAWADGVAFPTKQPNGWFDWTVYDYAYEMAARALLVATGRGDQLKATVKIEAPKFAPRLEWNPSLAAIPFESGMWKNPPDRDLVIKHPVATVMRGDLTQAKVAVEGVDKVEGVEITLRDREGKVVGEKVEKIGGGGEWKFKSSLPRGDYFACAQVKDKDGKVRDFASAGFRVETDVQVKDLKTERQHYAAGETIRGSFALTRPLKPGERVVVSARDTWGRLVASVDATSSSRRNKDGSNSSARDGDVASTFSFSIPVTAPLSRLWDIYATVRDDAGDVCDATCWVGIPNWDFDDYYAMLIFAPMPGNNGWKGELNGEVMGEHGINAEYNEVIYHRPDYLQHAVRANFVSWAYTDHHGELWNQPELVRLGIANTNLDIMALHEMMDAYVANGGQKIDEKKYPYTQHAMHARQFNQQLDFYEQMENFGVLGAGVTGENYLSGEFGGGQPQGAENSGFGPKTTKAFQAWCRKEYKNDLAALNREWNSEFKSWDEVKGVMLEEATENDQLPRWVDFRFFMRSEMWSGFFRKMDDYIHTRSPNVYAGFGGHANHDYTKYRGTHMTNGKLYVSQKDNWEWQDAFETEMRQSMSGDRGNWLGSQSSIRWTSDLNNPISRKRIAWGMLLMGMRGTDFENGVAGESFGGMAWTTPDFSEVLPYTEEVLTEVRKLQRGLARLVFKGKPWRSAVAINWSPRNHYISRLLPGQQPRGFSGTWLYNCSLLDGGPNDALGMMNSLRIRPTIICPEEIVADKVNLPDEKEKLSARFRAIWLPYNKGMSEEEAEAIRMYVTNGGLVLADNEPATWTQHGKKRAERLLKDLFPDFSKFTVTKVGKGCAVYLAGQLNAYPDRMLEGNFAGSDEVLRLLEEYAHVAAPVKMKDDRGLDVRDVRFTEYDNGGTRVLLFLRQHVGEMPNDSKTYALDFGGQYHIYDATKNHEYLGCRAYLDLPIDHYAKCLVLLPAKIKSATLAARSSSAPYQAIACTLNLSTSQPLNASTSQPSLVDCWHVEVFGPDGRECRAYRQNVMSAGTKLDFALPLALDAAKGTYRIAVESAATGVKAETNVEVK